MAENRLSGLNNDTPLKLGGSDVNFCEQCQEFWDCKFKDLWQDPKHKDILQSLSVQFTEIVARGMTPSIIIIGEKVANFLQQTKQPIFVSKKQPNMQGVGWVKLCGFDIVFYIHDELAKMSPHDALVLGSTNEVGGALRKSLSKFMVTKIDESSAKKDPKSNRDEFQGIGEPEE